MVVDVKIKKCFTRIVARSLHDSHFNSSVACSISRRCRGSQSTRTTETENETHFPTTTQETNYSQYFVGSQTTQALLVT